MLQSVLIIADLQNATHWRLERVISELIPSAFSLHDRLGRNTSNDLRGRLKPWDRA